MVTAIEELRKRRLQGAVFLNSIRDGDNKVKAFINANSSRLSPKEVQYMEEFRQRIGELYRQANSDFLNDPLSYPVAWRTLKTEIDACVAYLLPLIQSRAAAAGSSAFTF